MTLDELVAEFLSVRQSGGLVLSDDELLECALRATRFYAAYGDIRSLSGSDRLLGAAGDDLPAPAPLNPEPEVGLALPIKSLDLITSDTDLTAGEWAIVSPLFAVYADKENAIRLEATRGLGVDVYGRSVSEIAADIPAREEEAMQRAFQCAIITV